MIERTCSMLRGCLRVAYCKGPSLACETQVKTSHMLHAACQEHGMAAKKGGSCPCDRHQSCQCFCCSSFDSQESPMQERKQPGAATACRKPLMSAHTQQNSRTAAGKGGLGHTCARACCMAQPKKQAVCRGCGLSFVHDSCRKSSVLALPRCVTTITRTLSQCVSCKC